MRVCPLFEYDERGLLADSIRFPVRVAPVWLESCSRAAKSTRLFPPLPLMGDLNGDDILQCLAVWNSCKTKTQRRLEQAGVLIRTIYREMIREER